MKRINTVEEKLASIISDNVKSCGEFDPVAMDTIKSIAADMCEMFAEDSPRFNSIGFLSACGVL